MDESASPDRISVVDCDDHEQVTAFDGNCILCLDEDGELSQEASLALTMEKAKRGDEEAKEDLFSML